MILLVNMNLNAKKIDVFFETLAKTSKTTTNNVARKIADNGKVIKEKIQSKLDNISKLPKAVKQDGSKALIASKGDDIVKKGDFEKQFFLDKSFDEQMMVIIQSQKYGDEYFTIVKKLSIDDLKYLSSNKQLAKYLPASKYLGLTQNEIQSKFIQALEKTGSAGWSVLKDLKTFALHNPGWALLGSAYLWFSIDENGFMEALNESGKSAVDFISTVFTGVGTGVAEAVTDKAQKIVESVTQDTIQGSVSYLTSLLTGLFVLVVGFIIWRKRRVIQHFIMKADEVPQDNKSNNRMGTNSQSNNHNYQNKKDDNEF